MRISDWSSDVCSSDLDRDREGRQQRQPQLAGRGVVAPYDVDEPGIVGPAVRPLERLALVVRVAGIDRVADEEGFHLVGMAGGGEPRRRLQRRGGEGLVAPRSEERRGGKECVSTGRSRWWTVH